MNSRALILGLAFVAAGIGWIAWNRVARDGAGRESSGSVSSAAAGHVPAEPLFEDATLRAGIDFTHESGPVTLFQVPQVVGSGCALLDFDRDGDLDLFLVNQAAGSGFEGISSPVEQNSGLPMHHLLRQESDGRFSDVTAGSGLDVSDVGVGVAVADINNDGFPDIYLSCYGADRLFVNRRDGRFEDVTRAAGIDNLLWGTSCVFFDFDRDGWLDLFVANYLNYYPTRRCADPGGGQDFCQPKAFAGTPHKLYRNESAEVAGREGGIGTQVRFRDVSLDSGIARKSGPGLGVVAADFDGDRWPDLFVANDGAANFLWINRHDGTFSEEAVLRGAAYDLTGRPQANMGIAIGDVDGDGRLDLLVTHFDGEMNALYLNTASGNFEESAGLTGLGGPTLPYTSWGTAFFDIDHDGNLDLAVVNGRVKRSEAEASHYPPQGLLKNAPVLPAETRVSERPAYTKQGTVGWDTYAERNQLFLNQGEMQFAEVLPGSEPFCSDINVGRGLAVGDIDNDGDLDLVVTSVAGKARLFLNIAPKRGHWLQVRALEPALGDRDAYGALVTVTAGGRRRTHPLNAGFSYLCSNDPRVHFGLGDVDAIESVSIVWADGVEETFAGGTADRMLVLRRGEGHASQPAR